MWRDRSGLVLGCVRGVRTRCSSPGRSYRLLGHEEEVVRVTTFASTLNSPAEQRHIERLIVETFDATLVEGPLQAPVSLSPLAGKGSQRVYGTARHPAQQGPSASVVQKLWEDK
jgi:hypothetical protein